MNKNVRYLDGLTHMGKKYVGILSLNVKLTSYYNHYVQLYDLSTLSILGDTERC